MFPEFESDAVLQRLQETLNRYCPQVASGADCRGPCPIHALADDPATRERLLTAYATREAFRLQEFGQPT